MDQLENQVEFANKAVLITGGANGIGAGLARRLASQGARIAIADMDSDPGTQVASEVGGIFVQTDVTSFQANVDMVAKVVDEFGGLDVSILNAGVISGLSMGADFDPDRYRRVMAINLDGVVFGINASMPALKAAGGGDIVVTASMAGIAPTPFDPIYATNKTALVGLVRSFGLASVADGVRTNAVCPAFARTAMVETIEDGLTAAGVPLLEVEQVVDAYLLALTSGESAQCWFVQPGRPSEPFNFRRAPGPRQLDGSQAAAADPDVQMRIGKGLDS